jgi:hypothetical protein
MGNHREGQLHHLAGALLGRKVRVEFLLKIARKLKGDFFNSRFREKGIKGIHRIFAPLPMIVIKSDDQDIPWTVRAIDLGKPEE